MGVTDEESALAAIATLDPLSPAQIVAKADIALVLASNEPFIDIHHLLSLYNIVYFRSLLLPQVEASWSSRLTLCAGICELIKDDKGKYGRIRLKLSEPLLKFRPRSDVINTLLHEAIHAYFFITTSWRHSRGDDGTGHGAGFLLLADAINNHGAYEVTVYHTFHDEVDSYRTHVWQCDGPCKDKAPYFGLVKRSMNRPPGKTDTWWERHGEECGGTWIKIAEPALTKEQIGKLGLLQRAGLQKHKIDSFVVKKRKKSVDRAESATRGINNEDKKTRMAGTDEGNDIAQGHQQATLACPICDVHITETDINQHLDTNHSL